MKYSLSIRAIHWLSAATIIGLLILGVYMTPYDIANIEHSESLYFWHKSFGILSFLFVVVRIINKRRHALPELPTTMPKHEKLAAKFAHTALYLLMIVVPVLGYLQSSTYEFSSGIHFFGIDLPELVPNNNAIFEITNILHKWASYSLIAVLVAHVAGALKHRFLDKENDVLNRIL
ncbi:cytochrome b [Photobacterium sp. SDRW27]|uniref:cytochrome b n=1 Tax=Photobacterium obscurum TaxID=2829490 RepID=UPI002243DABC|nr:cytochrome b [Photobacterium obscurum]MCW8330165.1 cytochrome b [Photobacterium obscurum]